MKRKLKTYSALAALMGIGTWNAGLAQVTIEAVDNANQGADDARGGDKAIPADDTSANVLSPVEWRRLDAAVDRALAFLADQQQADGSFPTLELGQPGVTSLCMLAFMAHGHLPGHGPYGQPLERATEYIIECQKQNGLVSLYGPERVPIPRYVQGDIGDTAVYNHAIASLTLSELYGISKTRETERIEKVIKKSVVATLEMQRWPKRAAIDKGGWRYIDESNDSDSDLSVTGWQLMFLRSARNAGFDVPKKAIDDAVAYVRNTFHKEIGAFGYTAQSGKGTSRAMAGAGILALGHAGFHDSFEAQRTGQWLLQYSFEDYNGDDGISRDRYHYSLFNCCQGMYQLGSPYWEQFFPRVVRTVLDHQESDGSWPAERQSDDATFGNAYTTGLVVLSLGAPNQLLPIFQR